MAGQECLPINTVRAGPCKFTAGCVVGGRQKSAPDCPPADIKSLGIALRAYLQQLGVPLPEGHQACNQVLHLPAHGPVNLVPVENASPAHSAICLVRKREGLSCRIILMQCCLPRGSSRFIKVTHSCLAVRDAEAGWEKEAPTCPRHQGCRSWSGRTRRPWSTPARPVTGTAPAGTYASAGKYGA